MQSKEFNETEVTRVQKQARSYQKRAHLKIYVFGWVDKGIWFSSFFPFRVANIFSAGK